MMRPLAVLFALLGLAALWVGWDYALGQAALVAVWAVAALGLVLIVVFSSRISFPGDRVTSSIAGRRSKSRLAG